jgi:1-acyl-sn-glycerol-3-phosphate acyltransferase
VGPAGWAYGLIGVERDAGAKTLRTMLSMPARGWPKGARWRSSPKARGPGRALSAAIGLCRALQAARPAGGAGFGPQRRALSPRVEAARHDPLRDRQADPPGLPREEIEARVLDVIAPPASPE